MSAPASSLGESAFWDDLDQTLFWVDILQGTLWAWPSRGEPTAILTAVAGISLVRNAALGLGRRALVMAAQDGVSLLDLKSDRQPDVSVRAEFGRPSSMTAGMRFNDGECDGFGRLWIGTLSDEAQEPGRLYSLSADGVWREHLVDLDCPNGIGWNASQTVLYLVDSVTRRLLAADFDLREGIALGWRVAVQFDPSGAMPDGLTMAADGAMYVAFWGSGRVVLLDRVARVLACVHVGTPLVTSTVAVNASEMVVTTARASDGRSGADAGLLYSFPAPVVCAAPHRFGCSYSSPHIATG